MLAALLLAATGAACLPAWSHAGLPARRPAARVYAQAAPTEAVPMLVGRVNDEAKLLAPDEKDALEAKLAALETETGAQVVVLTVADLGGVPIEDYSIRVAEVWKVGHAGKDNGVIFIISRDDRKMRLEVGYGLEGVLTDLQAGRILSDLVSPRFKAGDYAGGINAGVDAVAAAVRHEPMPEAPADTSSDHTWLFALAFFLLAWAWDALSTPGAFGWVFYAVLAPFWYVIARFGIGPAWGLPVLASWLVGFPLLRLTLGPLLAAQRRTAAGGRRRSGGFWTTGGPGGGWSGGWGGGQSGGGGFSGGGGGFGGGGASGGW